MSRTGVTNLLVNDPRTHETVRNSDPEQYSMFNIWDKPVDDDHETTYQLLSPTGDVIDLTFTTNDPRAFDNWCVEEGLIPEKIHGIAREGLDSAHNNWFVKIIDNPVEIPDEQPEPEVIVDEKPKKPRRKRRTKAQIAADKAKAEEEKKLQELEPPKKPKRKRKAKAKTKAAPYIPEPVVIESNAEYLAQKDTTGWHQVPRALKKDASIWEEAEEVPAPVNRKQRRAAKKKRQRR